MPAEVPERMNRLPPNIELGEDGKFFVVTSSPAQPLSGDPAPTRQRQARVEVSPLEVIRLLSSSSPPRDRPTTVNAPTPATSSAATSTSSGSRRSSPTHHSNNNNLSLETVAHMLTSHRKSMETPDSQRIRQQLSSDSVISSVVQLVTAGTPFDNIAQEFARALQANVQEVSHTLLLEMIARVQSMGQGDLLLHNATTATHHVSADPDDLPNVVEQASSSSGTKRSSAEGKLSPSVSESRKRPPPAVVVSQKNLLYAPVDEAHLSDFQCFVRRQIELFEATDIDVEACSQGRNKPIQVGQVGIRCIHCAHLRPNERKAGSTYFPSQLSGIYQTARKLAMSHLLEKCGHIPTHLRSYLHQLKDDRSASGGGRAYWSDGARAMGVVQDASLGGLRLVNKKQQQQAVAPKPQEETDQKTEDSS